ncbi:MAG: V-type ATP synthase subunit F [Thermoproteota archaeon]
MKVVAVGNKEALLGFLLAGINKRLETEDPEEAVRFLHRLEKKESSSLVIVTSELYSKIREEIERISSRNPSFIFYNFSGGGLKWRK